MATSGKTVWELLWDYDPNGLVVIDADYRIAIVNEAFCEMFHVEREKIVGQHISSVMEDVDDFREVWNSRATIRGRQKEYPQHGLYVRKVMFPIPEQGVVACILVNISHELQQRRELVRLKEETLRNVSEVVDKHMKVAQEIAGLLGETTAETKVHLLRLAEMLKKEAL